MNTLFKQNPAQWTVEIASAYHVVYAQAICDLIEKTNNEPGVVLAVRSPEYIVQAMKKQQAVLALNTLGDVIGFCVIKLWDRGRYISASGLVVEKEYRKQGIGSAIIKELHQLCQSKYAGSIFFSLTASDMVIKTRLAMGFVQVPYSEITQDPKFWAGCQTCPHYGLFVQNQKQNCKCKVLIKIIDLIPNYSN